MRLDDVLADLLPRLEGRVAALKMDTEGFEPWVVQGGQTLFSKIKPNYMQLEVSDMTPEATGVGVHEFMTW